MEELNAYLKSGALDMREVARLAAKAARQEKKDRERKPARKRPRRTRPPIPPKSTRITRSGLARAIAGEVPLTADARSRMKEVHGIMRCHQCGAVKGLREINNRYNICLECFERKRAPGTVSLEAFANAQIKDVRRRCSRKDNQVTIDHEWIIFRWHAVRGKCELCDGGMTLEKGSKSERFGGQPLNLSLDQIRHGEGYTQDNVQLTHVRCNLMKMDMGMQEFVRTCAAVTQKFSAVSEKNEFK